MSDYFLNKIEHFLIFCSFLSICNIIIFEKMNSFHIYKVKPCNASTVWHEEQVGTTSVWSMVCHPTS